MAISYNPETGSAHFWDGNDWVPTKVSKNPQTGAAHVWDGQNWEPIKSTEPPKENLLSDLYGFGKKGVGEGISGVGWLADKATGYGTAMQKYGNEITEAADAAISPQAKERAGRSVITDAEPGKGLFGYEFNPSALAGIPYQAAESLPGMVAGIGATALAAGLAPATATTAIGVTALRVLGPFGVRAATAALGDAGVAAATAAGKNIIEAAAPAVGRAVFATLAGNASEGLQAAGMNGEQTETTILATLKADPSLLRTTKAGQEALQETGGDVEAAIKLAAAKASGKVAWQTGLSTALLATPGSAFEARMLQGGLKKGFLRETGLGAFSEGVLQEAPQSGAEQYLQNIAKMPYDPSITPGQGVLNAAVQGGIVGSAIGGGAGAVSNAVSGAAPDQGFIDRMGRRVSSDELNTAIGDVRRDAIARKAAAFSPEAVPENVDLVSDAVIEHYKQQGMSDEEIADVYPPYAAAMERRAAEFAAQQDAMREGVPGRETVDTPSYNLPPGMTVSEPTADIPPAPQPRATVRPKAADVVKDILERDPEEDAAINEGMAVRPGEYSARGGTAPDVASFVDSTFSFDNPATKRGDVSWLEAKQSRAEQDMQERPDNTLQGKGIAGSVTGWNETPVELPTSMLADVEGASGEQRVPGDPKYDSLVESVEENGWNPTPIKVRVSHRGVPYIVEGNTRAAVARDMGFPTIPAQIEWMNGAELSDSQWSPQGVSEGVMSAAPVEEERSVRGGIDLTPFEGLPLPKTLAGAKPRYKTLQLNFKNDLAKALYIAKDKPESNAYHKWLVKSGVPAEAIPALGQAVTNHIRGIADAQTTNAPIEVGSEALAAPAKKTTAKKPKAASATAPQAAPKPARKPKEVPVAEDEDTDVSPEEEMEVSEDEDAALSEEELAFEEEIAPTKRRKAREAEKAEEGPPDPERLKRSREIVNTFLKAMEGRGASGKTAAQAARRALFSNDVSHAEVHHLFVAHDIASRILGGTGANPTLDHVRGVIYDAARYRPGTKKGGIRGLIEFSLDPGGLPYMRETAYHEAFHVIQDLMQQYDPETAKLVFGAFKDGMTLNDVDASIKRTLQMASPEKGGPSYWDNFTKQYTAETKAGAELRSEFGKQREAMAYMFGMLADAKAQGHNVNTLSAPFKRFLNFIAQLRQRMGNYLRGQGYRSLQDVLNDYATGKAQQGYGAEVPVSGETEPEFSFVGKSAKTWDKALQDKAEALEDEGKKPLDIWMETGLHRGRRDREWRYEVPDNYAKFDPNGLKELASAPGRRVELGDLLLHPEIFNNYPTFTKALVEADSKLAPNNAWYFRDRGTIRIGLSLTDARELNSGTPNNMMKSLLHEVQHVIQDSEGFSEGTTSNASVIKLVADRIERAANSTLDEPKKLVMKALTKLGGGTLIDDWRNQVSSTLGFMAQKHGVRIIEHGFFSPKINTVFMNIPEKSSKEIKKDGIAFYAFDVKPSDDIRKPDIRVLRYLTKSEKDAIMADILSDPDMKAAADIMAAFRKIEDDLDARIAAWKKDYNKKQKAAADTYKKRGGKSPAYQTYEDEPGERESENVELRANLEPEERRNLPPAALSSRVGFNAEGALAKVIDSPDYARNLTKTIRDTIKAAMPDAAGEFSKRGGATAPAGENPFPRPPETDVSARLRRMRNRRKNEYEDGVSNGPKNERLELDDERKGMENRGKTTWIIGKITPEDWITRVEANLSPEEIEEAAQWYAQAMQAYSQYFGKDWPKYLAAWLMANQQASPATAQMNAIRAREKVLSGSVSGPKAGLAEERLIPFWRALEKGGELPLGGAQKLYDFIDSGLLRETRSWMHDNPEAGAPAVADVHSLRDAGFVDATLHKVLVKRYGDQAKDIPIDIGGSPSEAQYEKAADFLREVADYLNETNYLGHKWTPAEVQAVGWMSTSKFTGNMGQTPFEAIVRNIRELSHQISFGEGAPYATKFSDFEKLPMIAQREVVDRVLPGLTNFAISTAGVKEIGRVQVTGGNEEGVVTPSVRTTAVASPEAMEGVAGIIGWVSQLPAVQTYRLFPYEASGTKYAIRIYPADSDALVSNEAMGALFEKLVRRDLKVSGAKDAASLIQGYSTNEVDGKSAMIIMFNGKGDRLLKRIQTGDVADAIKQAANEMGIDLRLGLTYHQSKILQNQWSEEKNGEGYLRGLRERYGPNVQERLRDYQRNEFEPQLEQAIKDAKGRYGLKPEAEIARARAVEGEFSKRGGVEEGEKAIGRAIQAAGANAIANGGKVKRFLKSVFDPLAELPEREQYLLMRYKTLGNISALEREARGFYEIMKKATDLQKQQIYAYLTTRGAVAPALPPELRTVAMQVKTRINQIGAELVARGIVSPQSVAMYKDKYLPRLYMKYLLEDKGIAGAGIGVSSQDYIKERKSIGAEERVAMGEVTEPSFLSFAALYRPQRDMALLDFLEDVATTSGTDWVMPDQLLNWKGSKVTAFWLSDESKNIRERMLYEPNATKRATMERVANQMQALADPHLNNLVTENYKRLPKSNRYGALKGLAVRKEIYNDLIAAGGFDPDPSFIDKVFGDKNSSLARGTQFWKMTKTILNPPTQVRNFISNAAFLNLSGVPLHMVGPRMLQAITAMQKNSYAWKVAQEYGIDAGGFGENELRDAKEVLQEFLDQNVTGVMNPKHVAVLLGKITQVMGNAYQWSEMVFKTAKIIDELERKGVEQMPAGPAKTKAEGQAALEGHKWFFDYSLVPRSIKSLRTMPFGAPFITYYYKALPLLAEVAMNPRTAMRFAPYIALQAALPLLVASLFDVDEEDVEKLKNSMSEQLRDKPGMLIIPFKDEKDRWQFLDAGYFFPWTMFLTTAKSVLKGDVSGALGSVGALSSPALSAAVAIKTNIDPFSGRQIINPIDPPFEQMKSLLNYVNSVVSPPFLTSYGIVGKAIEAAQGSGTNRYGEPNMTATQIALRGIGFNVTPLIPELQRARNIEHLKNQLTLLKGRENQAVRDRSIGTVEERIEIRDRYREERTRLQEKIQQYIKDTELHPNLRTKTDGETP